MRNVFLVCLLVAGAFATPAERINRQPQNGIDDDALLNFALITMQKQGGDPMDLLQAVLPSLVDDVTNELDYERQLLFLATGGFKDGMAESILRDLMPMMKAKGKTTQEQMMTLMYISNLFCSKNSTADPECPEDAKILIPLMLMTSERACGYNETTDEGAASEDDICMCKEQTDAMFWLNLFESFWQKDIAKKSKAAVDQFPTAMMMMLNSASCDGSWKSGNGACQCTSVTKGHEPLLMQYLFTSKNVQDRLTPSQRTDLQELMGSPSQRVSSLQDFLFASAAGSTSPQILSLLQNQGESQSEILRQLILSSIPLSSSLVQILLNGGFNDDDNKVSLINYLTNIGSTDTSILPFLLGVENGQNFYLSNLIESGSIDPIIGLVLLANQAGTSQDELLEIIVDALAESRENPDYFTSLGRPYIPTLPAGIYPGSQLFFAHFETLEVNTCSLHDLRNRFECGYIGISAAECEVQPYCCYNPIFLTDVEVRNATDNDITSAIAVPWCYYNIFFIYYDSFYMEVQKPGGFASAIQCYGLFKYGLRLDPSLYYLFNPSDSNNGIGRLVNQRLECGFPGITEFQCVAIRGCCWDGEAPYRVPQCYRPNGPTELDFDYDKIPVAYRPPIGSCNVNIYQIPLLYYDRVACKYSFDFYIAGYNILAIPNRLDCLTKLGCCYEDNDEIVDRFPFMPRCYQRQGGTYAIPSGILDPADLFQRAGGDMDAIKTKFQPARNPNP
ncbi:unnamed protein product [Clavelina lepadiformis]|uniref:P-type domain-containing protein n=1 Tax=Clavelina lepadiformis TaxID=159417 RepID=A0ABP0FGS1_CLALP